MTAKEIRPFLATVASPSRALGAVLPRIATPEVTSPWTPRAEAPVAAAPSEDELAAIYEDARARGHADGRAETAALRDRLTAALAAVAAAHAAIAAPAAELIAEIAGCIVEAWTQCADRTAMFAPLVRGWALQSSGQPATARVHPDDVAALTEAVADAPITIVGDPAIARGALELHGAALELRHDWTTRLPDLRTAIEGALTEVES